MFVELTTKHPPASVQHPMARVQDWLAQIEGRVSRHPLPYCTVVEPSGFATGCANDLEETQTTDNKMGAVVDGGNGFTGSGVPGRTFGVIDGCSGDTLGDPA